MNTTRTSNGNHVSGKIYTHQLRSNRVASVHEYNGGLVSFMRIVMGLLVLALPFVFYLVITAIK